jgi:hypothetical protein
MNNWMFLEVMGCWVGARFEDLVLSMCQSIRVSRRKNNNAAAVLPVRDSFLRVLPLSQIRHNIKIT